MDASMEFERASLFDGGMGFLINQARNAVLAAMEQELAPLNVTAAQFIVILGIAHRRARTPSEIAKLLGSDSGATTRLLDRIESKGIIRRVRSTDDRRTVHIKLTAIGHALHPEIMVAVIKVHERLLGGFSESELGQFQALLRKISAHAKNF